MMRSGISLQLLYGPRQRPHDADDGHDAADAGHDAADG